MYLWVDNWDSAWLMAVFTKALTERTHQHCYVGEGPQRPQQAAAPLWALGWASTP